MSRVVPTMRLPSSIHTMSRGKRMRFIQNDAMSDRSRSNHAGVSGQAVAGAKAELAGRRISGDFDGDGAIGGREQGRRQARS